VTSSRSDAVDERDRDVIERCLRAAVEGPYFPDWEFHALFGFAHEGVRAVPRMASSASAVPDGYESAAAAQRVAVNNAMNNLLGYPYGVRGQAFTDAVGASEGDVAAVLRR